MLINSVSIKNNIWNFKHFLWIIWRKMHKKILERKGKIEENYWIIKIMK